MKKLMTALLALSFLTATISVCFAGDEKQDTSKKKKKKKKKEETPKKEGS
jgi:preprotein translocase subunit SecG